MSLFYLMPHIPVSPKVGNHFYHPMLAIQFAYIRIHVDFSFPISPILSLLSLRLFLHLFLALRLSLRLSSSLFLSSPLFLSLPLSSSLFLSLPLFPSLPLSSSLPISSSLSLLHSFYYFFIYHFSFFDARQEIRQPQKVLVALTIPLTLMGVALTLVFYEGESKVAIIVMYL
jgi:hypothetical protein